MMTATATNIRRLFLRSEPSYSVAEAAKLLGMRARELRDWIEAGEIEPVDTDDGPRIPWAEVVSFGMDLWSQEVVEAALGADVAEAIPELLRLTELEVRIPRLEVVALERVAGREGRTVDALLARELLDFVSTHAEWLEGEIPGVAEALAWPHSAPLPPDGKRAGGSGGAPLARRGTAAGGRRAAGAHAQAATT
jgi:hypothetical protein